MRAPAVAVDDSPYSAYKQPCKAGNELYSAVMKINQHYGAHKTRVTYL